MITQRPEAAILTNSSKFLAEIREPPYSICSLRPSRAAILQIAEILPVAASPEIRHIPLSLIAPAMLQKTLELHSSVTSSSKSTISNP